MVLCIFIQYRCPDITTRGLSGPGSNCNEGVLHTLQSFRTGAPPLYAV